MICQQCGMEICPDQYHSYEYCVLYLGGINPDEFVACEVSRLTPVVGDGAMVHEGENVGRQNVRGEPGGLDHIEA